jgi:multimeric flavodoxin WrbA
MKIMVFASSPNSDGLTQACADAVCEGVRAAGLEADLVRLNDERIGLCHACAQGWGTCRTEHRCQVLDGFQDLHKRAKEADGYAVVSPVYFGELSESAKVFFDRLRRCEATRGDESVLANKPMLAVAAAGGGGGGTTSCLDQMNRLFGHLRASTWDLIAITRKTRSYKIDTIRSAAQAMAQAMQSK